MELQEIKILLQKYFEGNSSVSEEKILREYFHSDSISEDLISYVPVFKGISEVETDHREPEFEEEIMNFILEEENREKNKYRWQWQVVTGVAASLILVLLSVNFFGDRSGWKDTYSDPQEAYVEASKTLEYVAGKYRKGLAQLQPVRKVDKATDPFYSGVKMLDKGFRELNEFEKVNKKLKKE